MDEPWAERSNTKQDIFNKEAGTKTEAFLKNEFMPAVIADLKNELGCNVNCYIEDDEPQTVVFAYNRSFDDTAILPVIRLEIGALAAWTPAAEKTITPYAAEQYGRLFKQPSTEILTVLPKRTFWEKVTILHREAYRPENSTVPTRYSRHYYGRKYYDDENPNSFKIDVILFAADDDCIAKLNRYSEDTFHRLNDENRKYVNKLSERFRKQYHDIIADGDPVSKHSFRLPETLRARQDKDGKAYDNHLFVDEETGTATIRLNGWEEGVLEEEAKQNDFVCWIRNLPQDRTHATCSLCIPYEMNDEIKPTFPDFIVIRSDPKLDYLIDILEPHNPDYKDNLGKAKGFAKYAEENLGIGRIQLIRMGKDAAGKNRFKRLDMSLGSVRQKVLHAQNNDEIDHIFDTDGFFM